mmetsp:Transcript_133852/g.416316  ORF Transcript_133852/g.416316 Transcript_133852/m.416316 type:complete len:310 (-) Transcript_133852:208-1137(-)
MFLFLELVPIKLTHPLHLHDQRDDGHWQDDRHCKQDADDGGPVPPVPCHLLKELGRVRQGKEAEHGPGAQCLQCQSASADVHGPREVQQAEAGMLHEEVGPRHATAAEPGAPREEEHEVPKQAGEHQAEHRKLEPADAQCGCMEVGQWLPGIVAVDEIDGNGTSISAGTGDSDKEPELLQARQRSCGAEDGRDVEGLPEALVREKTRVARRQGRLYRGGDGGHADPCGKDEDDPASKEHGPDRAAYPQGRRHGPEPAEAPERKVHHEHEDQAPERDGCGAPALPDKPVVRCLRDDQRGQVGIAGRGCAT